MDYISNLTGFWMQKSFQEPLGKKRVILTVVNYGRFKR